MRKTLLTMLIVGLLAFGWVSCVSNLAMSNIIPIPGIERTEHNYIGWRAVDVIKKMGSPHREPRCQIELPSGINGQTLVMGEGALWHFDGELEGNFTHYTRKICAVHGTVVTDAVYSADRNADGESTLHVGYTDYLLIRKLLEAGPKQDGKNGRYIVKPGNMEI